MTDINDILDPMSYPTDLSELKDWLDQKSIKVEIREHKLYTISLDLSPVLARIAGTDQLIAQSKNGQISVIRGMASAGHYEIYSLEGNLFDEIERYPDVESAGQRIHFLLTQDTVKIKSSKKHKRSHKERHE